MGFFYGNRSEYYNRSIVKFGGLGIGSNTARRGMGTGDNLSGEHFIFETSNGVDIIVGFDKITGDFFSESVASSMLGKNNVATGIRGDGKMYGIGADHFKPNSKELNIVKD